MRLQEIDFCYTNLVIAIIKQAEKDYIFSTEKLKQEDLSACRLKNARKLKRNVELFYHSKYCNTITFGYNEIFFNNLKEKIKVI